MPYMTTSGKNTLLRADWSGKYCDQAYMVEYVSLQMIQRVMPTHSNTLIYSM